MSDVKTTIEHEHRNLARVLAVLESIVTRLASTPEPDDVDRLFDICQYARVFPDKIHHPKEEQYILNPLRTAAPDQHPLLDRIQAQHEQCSELTERLYDAVRGYDTGRVCAADLASLAREYIEFQYDHMRTEERQLLPLALERLAPETLSAAGQSFARHGDPLFGDNLETAFATLHHRIVQAS